MLPGRGRQDKDEAPGVSEKGQGRVSVYRALSDSGICAGKTGIKAREPGTDTKNKSPCAEGFCPDIRENRNENRTGMGNQDEERYIYIDGKETHTADGCL